MTTAHTPYRGERTTVDSSLPPTMTPEGSAAVAAAASRPTRSEGLNSLFEPTAGETKSTGKHAATTTPSSHMGVTSGATSASAEGSLGAFTRQPAQSSAAAAMSETARKASAQASSAYDPQSAYAQAQGARYVAKRSCTVLKPASYGEVEKIAGLLKAAMRSFSRSAIRPTRFPSASLISPSASRARSMREWNASGTKSSRSRRATP